MKHKSIINALAKHNLSPNKGNRNDYFVTNKGKVLSWYIQGDDATAVHLSKETDVDDPYTDYFPGSFAYSLKRAINHIVGES